MGCAAEKVGGEGQSHVFSFVGAERIALQTYGGGDEMLNLTTYNYVKITGFENQHKCYTGSHQRGN